MDVAFPGWRGRLVFDAYSQLPDGEGVHKRVVESYVALAEKRGHTLPKNSAHFKQTIKNEVHRSSSDAAVYAAWRHKRPDLYCMIEPGRWGLRQDVLAQARNLNFSDDETLAGIPPVRRLNNGLFVPNTEFDEQELYVMGLKPNNLMKIPEGTVIFKIGIGDTDVRKKNLQTGNPLEIVPIYSTRGREVPALENKIKKLMENQRMPGGSEWFHATIHDLAQIGAMILVHNAAALSLVS